MTSRTYERLESRWRVEGVIRLETALRIGAGKSYEAEGTDLPVLRDAQDRPYLPGSSIKGAVRSGLEAVLRGLEPSARPALWACDPLSEGACAAEFIRRRDRKPTAAEIDAEVAKLCTACALFGNPILMGRTFIRDAAAAEGWQPAPVVRDGVGIDRETGAARDKIKYDYEVVPAGCRFTLEVVVENPDDVQLGLVLQAIDMLGSGEIVLGGATTRGLGRVSVHERKLTRTDARGLLTGKDYEVRNWSTESRRCAAEIEKRLGAAAGAARA